MGHIGTKERFHLKDGRIITCRNEYITYCTVSIYVDGEVIFYYELKKVEYLNDYNVVIKTIIPKYPN